MFISESDLLLTLMFAIGLFQYFWFSVMFVRKGVNPSTIRLYMLPILTVWVLIWPAYENTALPLLSLTLLLIPLLFALRNNSAFARHLRLAWHGRPEQLRQPTPWLMLWLSLMITTTLFHQAPELGLGAGLSLTLAWSAAEIWDKSGHGFKLGLSHNPSQSLAGHLIWVLASSLLCAWALQLYHGISWHTFMVATVIAGFVASMIRALIPQGWNLPMSMLGLSLTLWIL